MSGTDLFDDLRDMLAEQAEEVRVPVGLARRAADAAGRVRVRRRAVALAACIAVLSTLVIQAQQRIPQEPAMPTPSPGSGTTVTGQVVWTETLPGLDLPLGAPLTVPYGVGSSVFVDGQEHVLPSAVTEPTGGETPHLVQITDTPLGLLTVTKVGHWVFNLRLLDGEEVRDIGGAVQLAGTVAVGAGPDGKIHIAFANDETPAEGVYEGPLLDPQPIAVGEARRHAVGFFEGDPLFDLAEQPGSLERFRRTSAGESSTQLEQTNAALGPNTVLAGWTTDGGEALAIYTDVDRGCTSAYQVPGSGELAWEACDDLSRAVMITGPRYGAVGVTAYDLEASGARARTFELPQAARFEIAPIGWETPTHLILRVVSYEPYGEAGTGESASLPPRYVAVRCAVDTGVCQRLPHPVETVVNNIGTVLPPN